MQKSQTYQTLQEDKETTQTGSSWLGRKPELRRTRSVEHYELTLEENVAVDREANTGI